MLFEDLPNVSNKKVPSVSVNAEMFPVVSNIFVFLRQRHKYRHCKPIFYYHSNNYAS